MNTKIYPFVCKKLEEAFKLPRYSNIHGKINASTHVDQLPWTPARLVKFEQELSETFDFPVQASGTVVDLVNSIDQRYMMRFFSEIWKPQTEHYQWSGWNLVDEINARDPKSVLDVGCGYHPFKGRIRNIVGIDPYNHNADYMVDILEYRVKPHSHDHIIALGSINFNSYEDIQLRLRHCVDLLAPGGRMYFRVNPGITHVNGPWIDIFPWNFEIVNNFCEDYTLTLETFKKDSNQRLFFICSKPE